MSETTDEFDSAVLVSGWAAIAERRPQLHVEVDWAARTDIGRTREHNEDKFDFFLPVDPTQLAVRGRLWAIADGMGGHHAGQIASEAALKTAVRAFYHAAASEDTPTALRASLSEANALIHHAARQMERKGGGMGTTIVVIVVKEDVLTVAHVGDSRCYLLRPGEPFRSLTTDHSWVEEQVKRGALSRAEAEISPYRNYILRSIGVEKVVEPDVIQITLQVGDTLLLCSDGLCGYIKEESIAKTLADKGASQAVLDLVDVANDAGGKDNVTALVVRVLNIAPYPTG
jgi:protein phosphatase